MQLKQSNRNNAYIVDRIEDGVAVLYSDDGSKKEIRLADFPKPLSQGDMVFISDGKYCKNTKEAEERKNKLIALRKELSSDREGKK